MATAVSPPPRFENVNLLRAFAALSVVAYHVIEHGRWTSFPVSGPLVTLRIGWIGVDLFFVISGFVIAYSALLLRAADRNGFAASYWRRRLARILPLYLLTIALWIAAFWHGFFGQSTRDWVWQLFAHLAFVHSFFPSTHGGIDGVNWTLAIEMQFYLAVALLIGWIERTPGWRILLYGISIAWAWRACAFFLYAPYEPSMVYLAATQFPGSLDEFAAGIFLAKHVLAHERPARGETALWLAGAGVLGYLAMSTYWAHSQYWNSAGMVSLWRTPFAAFLACVVATAVRLPGAIALRWLRPLDYLGEVSYGIYLWHLFAIELVIQRQGLSGIDALVWVVALTVAAAGLSWHGFEKPFLRFARRPAANAWLGRDEENALPTGKMSDFARRRVRR